MKNVLVTGGAGFLGSHLVDALLAKSYSVTAIDNLYTGRFANLEHLSGHDRFEFIEAELGTVYMETFPHKDVFDQIYHLASPASPKAYQAEPVMTYMVNAFVTHFLAGFAEATGARLFFASTSEIYGDPLEHPQSEDYFGNVNIRGPRANYDVSKRFGEMVQVVWEEMMGLDIRTVRIFNTFGPRMAIDDGRIFPNLITQALKGEPMTVYGDGSQTRSYCYVDDLVAGMVEVMEHPRAQGEVYNLGNPGEYTVLETAQIIKETVGSNSEIVFLPLPKDDPKRRRPDISRIKRHLGWEPIVSFESGLAKTIEYFRHSLELA